jgi:23S rRNA (guanosine2251-2'-O)-methyltransferase
MEELNRLSVEEFRNALKLPVVCILDNIRSQHNIGSVFRTADAFGIEEIFLCGITATPPSREIQKTALGATESVKWTYFEHTTSAIENLKSLGYKIIAIEQVQGSVSLHEFKADKEQKLALIFGNEVDGVGNESLELCDAAVEIPQFGTKHSFNISVTAGIVLWQISQLLSR